MSRYAIAVFALLAFAVPVRATEVAHTPVFVAGQGGYHTYRIPSVIVTPKGTVLAFCEGRRAAAATRATSICF